MVRLIIFLAAGAVGMFLCMLYCRQIYPIPKWKIAVSTILLTISGILGAYLMGFIENGRWGIQSFYGAVFLVPVMMWLPAMLLKIPYGVMMDICAPAECIMLALLKINCKITGCCGGLYFYPWEGMKFQFPSQIAECITAILLMLFLIHIIKKKTHRNMIYPLYLLTYGIIRFILNFFRFSHFWIGPLAAGTFWSLISIAIGGIVLLIDRYKRRKPLAT